MSKRYFQREYEESYWIFDSEVITEKEVDNELEYSSNVLADSMQGTEVEDRLNYYENELEIKIEIIGVLMRFLKKEGYELEDILKEVKNEKMDL